MHDHPIAYLIGVIIGWILRIAFIGFILWLVISFVEIIFRNGNPETVYSTWNFWQMIFQ